MNPFENQLMLSRRNGVVDGYLLPGTRVAGVRLGDAHVYDELVRVEQAALARGPRMNGLGSSGVDQYAAWVQTPQGIAYGVIATASMAVSAYHGYKRNNSVGWALVWGAFGAVFPVITPVIAVAEGYGKRAKK